MEFKRAYFHSEHFWDNAIQKRKRKKKKKQIGKERKQERKKEHTAQTREKVIFKKRLKQAKRRTQQIAKAV